MMFHFRFLHKKCDKSNLMNILQNIDEKEDDHTGPQNAVIYVMVRTYLGICQHSIHNKFEML